MKRATQEQRKAEYMAEIKPPVGHQRGVAVHHVNGSLGLHMYWAVDGPVTPTEHHPNHGLMMRTVAYLSEAERRMLASHLMEGLDA